MGKLCQEKPHTPTRTTHTQFQLQKLALNVSWHSGNAWGNAIISAAQCWMPAQQYAPSPALLVPMPVTEEVSHRPQIKSAHDDRM